MNERHSYEQLIADKLQRLPSPDADASWQRMRRLLDDEDNKTRGGGKNRGPGSGWWKTGLMAIALIAGLWFYSESRKTSHRDLSAVTVAGKKESGNSNIETNKKDNNKSAITDNNTTLNKSGTLKENTADKNNTAIKNVIAANSETKNDAGYKKIVTPASDINAGSAVAPVKPNNSASNKPGADNEPLAITVKDSTTGLTTEKLKPGTNDPLKAGNESTSFAENNKTKTTSTKLNTVAGEIGNADNAIVSSGSSIKKSKDKKAGEHSGFAETAGTTQETTSSFSKSSQQKDHKSVRGFIFQPRPVAASTVLSYRDDKLKGSMIDPRSPASLVGTGGTPFIDSIASLPDPGKLLTRETKALAARAKNEKDAEWMAKKEKKSLKLNFSGFFKPFSLRVDAEPWWAAGLAVNHVVGLNNQNRFNYNVNGKSGLIGDYIPSPFVQFHLNDYVYMQTELNLSMPQLTPSLLVYQKSADIGGTPGMRQEKSVYIQKLYYFNWPVSLHYSPVNNLFLSAGLQFSSFQSGLALIQTKTFDTSGNPANPVAAVNSIEKFKDDSIATKLSPIEWRWQAGADYYLNRFSIGVRYSKSFRDLLNVTIDHHITTGRNAAFVLFARYNLFDGRKRDNPKQNTGRY